MRRRGSKPAKGYFQASPDRCTSQQACASGYDMQGLQNLRRSQELLESLHEPTNSESNALGSGTRRLVHTGPFRQKRNPMDCQFEGRRVPLRAWSEKDSSILQIARSLSRPLKCGIPLEITETREKNV